MLPLVKNDPWLEPVVKQVDKRHDRSKANHFFPKSFSEASI